MKHHFALGIAAAALIIQPVQAKTQSMAPSQWVLSYDEEGCRLVRFFGDEDARTALVLMRNEPGSRQYSIIVAGKSIRKIKADRGVKLGFGPGVAPVETKPGPGKLAELSPALLFGVVTIRPAGEITDEGPTTDGLALQRAAMQKTAEDGITYMTVADRTDELRLELGPMAEVNAAVRHCTDGLIESWGLDPALHADMTRGPVPIDMKDWIRSSDYPMNMLTQKQNALISFRVIVTADGKPTECFIQSTTRPKAFDDAVCSSLMKYARFEPALDANGAPMKSYFQTHARFQIS